MSTRKTIKFTLNSQVVFRLEISGSNEIVNKLIADHFFNSALRDAAETLIKQQVVKNTVQTTAVVKKAVKQK